MVIKLTHFEEKRCADEWQGGDVEGLSILGIGIIGNATYIIFLFIIYI